jgi:tetratricopeptide (TPR) repeat protein
MSTVYACPKGHRWGEQARTPAPVCPQCGSTEAQPVAEALPATLPTLTLPKVEPETLTPPTRTPTPRPIRPTAPPRPRVPGYEIEKELGRGGMGVVYQARQVSLGRSVALKMILTGQMAGEEELMRFRREAEAVARLQHPNIVQIHEVGEHDGCSFFSLELCPGGSLAAKLGRKPLPPRQAAELAETLAHAVQAAHDQGIVHRDLKPANVLLSADGTPKITDFGLAKRLDEVGQTQTGAVMGTPSYMAPEQAAGQSKQIGPATDVYALGVILYEMLTGRTPFGGGDVLEVLQRAIYDEPISPRLLRPSCPRDLETICLKCLHKEQGRRYHTARELADDLHCYLKGRPITARPVGRLERLSRWCVRRPVTAGLLAALVVAVATGFSAVTWMWLRAEEFRVRAEQQRDRAEENFRVALEASVDATRLAEQLKPIAGTQSATVKEILTLALDNYERLRERAGESRPVLEGEGGIRASFSDIYLLLGDTTAALQSAQQACAIYEQLLREEPDNAGWRAGRAGSLVKVANALLPRGQPMEAERAVRTSLELRQQLVDERPDDPARQMDLAASDDALGTIRQALGDLPGAAVAFRRALALRLPVAEREPRNRTWRRDAALSQQRVADMLWNDAWEEPALREVLGLYTKAEQVYAELAREEPDNAEWQRRLAEVHLNLGQTYCYLKGEESRARSELQRAVEIAERQAALDPTSLDWAQAVFRYRTAFADLRRTADDVAALKQKAVSLRELLPLARKRWEHDGACATWQANLIQLQDELAVTLAAQALKGEKPEENNTEARRLWEEARRQAQALVQRCPDVYRYRMGLGFVEERLGLLLQRTGAATEGWRLRFQGSQEAIDYYQRQAAREPDHVYWQEQLVKTYTELAQTHLLAQTAADAAQGVKLMREALRLAEALRDKEPDNLSRIRQVAETRVGLINALTLEAGGRLRQGEALSSADVTRLRAEAVGQRRELVQLCQDLLKRDPKNLRWYRELAAGYSQLHRDCINNDRAAADQAVQDYSHALDELLRHCPEGAERDPFEAGADSGLRSLAIGLLFDQSVKANDADVVTSYERSYLAFGSPAEADTLVNHYIQLARSGSSDGKTDPRQSVWALRRGLGLLHARQAAGTLHPLYCRYPDFFAAALARLPAPTPAVSLEPPEQAAFVDMAYGRLARLLLDKGRSGDLLCVLNGEAREATEFSWVRQVLREHLVVELLGEPEALAALLDAAKTDLALKSPVLTEEGRKLLAFLARHAGEEETAMALDAPTARSPLDGRFFHSLVSWLLAGRHYLSALRVVLGNTSNLSPGLAEVYAGRMVQELYATVLAQKADEVIRQALHQRPPASALAVLAPAERLRRLHLVREQLTTLLEKDQLPAEKRSAAELLQVAVLTELGELEEAERLCRAVAERDPKNVLAVTGRAYLQIARGEEVDAAIGCFRQQVQRAPGIAYWQHLLGWGLCQAGRLSEGIPLLEKSNEDKTLAGEPAAWEHLADAYQQAKRTEEARTCWQRALKAFPPTTDPDDPRKTAIEHKLAAATTPARPKEQGPR